MAFYHPVSYVNQWHNLNHPKSDWINCLLPSPFVFFLVYLLMQQKASSDVNAHIPH